MPVQPQSEPRFSGTAVYALGAAVGTALLQTSIKQLREVGYSTELLLSLRYTGALLISLALVLRYVGSPIGGMRGMLLRFKPKKLSELLLRGVLMLGTTLGVFLSTEYLTVAQLAALSLATWPVFTLLLSPLFGEPVSKLAWVFLSTATSLAGLAVLVLADGGVADPSRFIKGALIVCGASVCTAFNFHFGRRAVARKEDQFVTMFYQSLLGAPLSAALWFVPIGPFAVVDFDPGQVTLGHLPWLGLVAVLGFLPQLWYLRASNAPVFQTLVMTALQPIVAALFDLQFDGVRPSTQGLVGLGILVGGALLGQPAARKRQEPPEPGTN